MSKPRAIPYGRQSISEDDIKAVVEVLRSDWLTQGPAVGRFERRVAEYCGAKYAVAVNSATSGLHIACLALGLGRGDRLWTSANTFVASANCGLYCGATVDFVDIDPSTGNMSVEHLAQKLAASERAGTLPKIVIPVHFGGQSCPMEEIAALARRYGFHLIEDASHAIGGRYKETRVGSCAYCDLAVFSFHPVKIITTGEGGMVLANRDDLQRKLMRLRSHGTTRDPAQMEGESHGPWYYQQLDLGYNYRMTDIQAALGLSQMGRIDEFVTRRHQLAGRYDQAFRGMAVETMQQRADAWSAYHLYVIRLQLEKIGRSHRRVFEDLRERGVQVNLHYIPVHLQPYFRKMGFKAGDFPNAEAHYSRAITIPLYHGLSEEDQDRVIRYVRDVLG
jgi:UDP-4-amino-4,6-dideoxy-N-acetyl-beta-L-altrosamine transaminase